MDQDKETDYKSDTFYLQFSKVCKPFGLPGLPKIAQAAMGHFLDPGMSLDFERQGSDIIYRIELTKEVEAKGHKLEFKVQGKKYELELETTLPQRGFPRTGGRSREGLLPTFQKAGQKKFNNIPNSYFDKLLQDVGLEVIKPCEKQKIRGQEIFNGNRYAVITVPENHNIIPDSLPVKDPGTGAHHQLRISYKGQARYCGRCCKRHVGQCPALEEFYRAKTERDRMAKDGEVSVKIVSDSTLRHANTLGLRADVMCMSGAGLGQVAQATLDDPNAKNSTIIIAGANDIKNKSYETEEEFAQSVQTSVRKIEAMVTDHPENSFVLVSPNPIKDDYTPENEKETARKNYVHKVMEDLAEKENINNVQVQGVIFEADETGHPTIAGTREIISQLSNCAHRVPELVWHEEYATSERAYWGVESIFRYGCNHCDSFGKHISHEVYRNVNLCDSCHEVNRDTSLQNSYPEMTKIILSVKQAKVEWLSKKRGVESTEPVDFKREKLDDTDDKENEKATSDSDTLDGEGQ